MIYISGLNIPKPTIWQRYDTSIIQSHSSLQILSKRINKDLFNLTNWLKANKLSVNIKKMTLVLFRPKKLKLDHSFKFKIYGKRLIPIYSVKYLRVLLDEHSLGRSKFTN